MAPNWSTANQAGIPGRSVYAQPDDKNPWKAMTIMYHTKSRFPGACRKLRSTSGAAFLMGWIASLMISPITMGQGLTSQISGSVHDPSGKAVQGASLVLVNAETGQLRETTTNGTGDFLFVELLPGAFNLQSQMVGFKKFEQKGIILSASERLC